MPPIPLESHRAAFAHDVKIGLGNTPKSLPAKYFYDAAGSALFEEITRLPEYYQTRTEADLLRRFSPALAARLGDDISLVELGSGSSSKTAIVLETLLDSSNELHYLPIDISKTMLVETATRLDARYPELEITPIASAYESGLQEASTLVAQDDQIPDRMLVLFLGSSIGNLEPDESVEFLQGLRQHLEPEDAFLIGFDLEKDRKLLTAAYNDSAGVTARFNRNVLVRINAELGGEFDVELFSHRAFYNEDAHRIEMHLRSEIAQEIRIEACETTFHFAAGETIHTESSYKFTPSGIRELAAASGFQVEESFIDDNEWFALVLLTPV